MCCLSIQVESKSHIELIERFIDILMLNVWRTSTETTESITEILLDLMVIMETVLILMETTMVFTGNVLGLFMGSAMLLKSCFHVLLTIV